MTEINAFAHLKGLGLTENDLKVYVFLLERGTAFGGSKIAARLTLHRQYVHNSLQKLIEMELVEESLSGARKAYRALPAQQLSRIAQRRLEETKRAVRELDQISAVGAEQDFEIFRGRQQVLEFESGLVESLKEDEVQYIIGGGTQAFMDFFGAEYAPISRIAKAKRLRSLYVGNPNEKPLFEGLITEVFGEAFQCRYLPTMPTTIVQTVVRFDTVTIYTFGNPPQVYFLKSKTVAEDYKKFFDMLWDMAKPS